MNFREGTRRLALLLGVVGVILGGFASYIELQTTLDQRARHKRFEQLATSDIVKHAKPDWFTENAPKAAPGPWDKYKVTDPNGTAPSEVDKDGIKTIHWAKDYEVESIGTEDGQTLYSTPAPSVWTYLLIAFFPIVGFFIPWGAVCAIGWVGAGFVQPSK